MTIIDAAMPGFYDDIPKELAAMGRWVEDVRAVVLTHGHSDHLGFAERVRTERKVPVWIHEADAGLARAEDGPEQPDGQDPPRAAAGLPVAGAAQRRPQAAGRQGRLDLRRRGDTRRAGQPAGDAGAGPYARERSALGDELATRCSWATRSRPTRSRTARTARGSRPSRPIAGRPSSPWPGSPTARRDRAARAWPALAAGHGGGRPADPGVGACRRAVEDLEQPTTQQRGEVTSAPPIEAALPAWHDFFVASTGAAAVLLGLTFVGLTIHVERRGLDSLRRGLAIGSATSLLYALFASLLMLMPEGVRYVQASRARADRAVRVHLGRGGAGERTPRRVTRARLAFQFVLPGIAFALLVLGGVALALGVEQAVWGAAVRRVPAHHLRHAERLGSPGQLRARGREHEEREAAAARRAPDPRAARPEPDRKRERQGRRMTRHKRISIVITTVFGFIYIMANAQLLPRRRPPRSG